MKFDMHKINGHNMVWNHSSPLRTVVTYKCKKCGIFVTGGSPSDYAEQMKKTKECKKLK